MRKITLLFASLFVCMSVVKANFVQSYDTSASLWKAWEGETSEALQAVITGHNCSAGTVHYGINEVIVSAEGDINVEVRYSGGSHMIVILGIELLNADGTVAYSDYHIGTSGSNHSNNTYTLSGVAAGNYTARYFVCNKANDHELTRTNGNITFTGNITEKTFEAEPISTEYCYQIQNVAYSRMLASDGEYATVTATNDASDANQLWAFEAGETEGTYKIKNAGKGVYLSYKSNTNEIWPMSATASDFTVGVQVAATINNPTTIYTIKHENGDNQAYAHDANWYPNGGRQVVRWLASSSGSQWRLIKTDVSTEAMPLITYKFTYNGEEKFMQESSAIVGKAYPDYSVVFPFGVKAKAKPEGVVDQSETIEIELYIDLPFEYAESYESIATWYYLNIRDDGPTYLYYDSEATHIPATETSVPIASRDIYSWAFVGNPFDGFSIVNYAAGATMVLSAPKAPTTEKNADELARMVAKEGATGNLTWNLNYATHNNAAAQAFYVEHPTATSFAFNRQAFDGKNALCYWNGRDTGSAIQVVERNDEATLQDLIDNAKADMEESKQGTVGYLTVPEENADKVADAITAAERAIAEKQNYAEAQIALEKELTDAQAAAFTIQPATDKYYTIVSATSATDERCGQMMYVNYENVMQFCPENNDSTIFQFVEAGEGKFYLYNVNSKAYLSTAKQANGGANEVKATDVTGAKAVTITNMGRSNVVKIVPEGGAMLHAQAAGSKVVGWDDNSNTSASAWIIVEKAYNPDTAIEHVSTPEAAVIYDLLGRRVQNVEKGIYIVNGRKVVIK